MSLEIRPLIEAELPAVIAGVGQPRFFTETFQRQAFGDGVVLVAWEGGHAIGDVFVRFPPADEPEIRELVPDVPMLVHLEVCPQRQNQGIGTAIINAAQDFAVTRGYDNMIIAVDQENPNAHRLYERLGYFDWGEGPIDVSWDHPLPDGPTVAVTARCNVLIRPILPGVPAVADWAGWHPSELPTVFADSPVPWAVAGGWAIDLFLGAQTREHEDTEVAIPRGMFDRVRPLLADYRLYWAKTGRVVPLGATDAPPAPWHQVWVCDPSVPTWRMDLFLEDGDGQTWVSHRDPRFTLPYARAIRRTADGIPYLAPETVLFAKARHTREKDQADFDAALPRLDAAGRVWLRNAMIAVYPDHPWTARLS